MHFLQSGGSQDGPTTILILAGCLLFYGADGLVYERLWRENKKRIWMRFRGRWVDRSWRIMRATSEVSLWIGVFLLIGWVIWVAVRAFSWVPVADWSSVRNTS